MGIKPPKRFFISAMMLICLICLGNLVSCDQVELLPTASSLLTTTPTDSPGISLLSDQIASILSSPQNYHGKEVEIIGYFRGWDLLAEAGGSPPVTRSDWVIKDKSGAIYVTGTLPEGLDPSTKDAVWTIVRLRATVETDGKNIYLKSSSVEIVKTK